MRPQHLPPTPTDKEISTASALVDKVVVPRFQAIIDELNTSLAQYSLRAGADITWLFERAEKEG